MNYHNLKCRVHVELNILHFSYFAKFNALNLKFKNIFPKKEKACEFYCYEYI